ncbi:hypothetical protein MRB53_016600 [Persea americana]|uniref:Uncharacterized protein n=1 Tax=Persea americana TaxID=3435 RepID=A0ACC2M3K5_PERAE|nr:hypothetical protein MRB53_016600 [Persea americana]
MDEGRRTRKKCDLFLASQRMDNWRHLFLIGHCNVAVGLLRRGFLNNREESSMDEGHCIGKRTISFWLRNEWRTGDTSS